MDLKAQWLVFTPSPENPEMKTATYYLDCVNVFNEKWTVKFKDGKFWGYRNGKKDAMHHGDVYYKNPDDGNSWELRIENGKMMIGPAGWPIQGRPDEVSGLGWKSLACGPCSFD
jgi:hypothetical protein